MHAYSTLDLENKEKLAVANCLPTKLIYGINDERQTVFTLAYQSPFSKTNTFSLTGLSLARQQDKFLSEFKGTR